MHFSLNDLEIFLYLKIESRDTGQGVSMVVPLLAHLCPVWANRRLSDVRRCRDIVQVSCITGRILTISKKFIPSDNRRVIGR